MICEAPDKDAIKISEAKEGMYVLYFSWCRPVLDAGNFDRVHLCHPPSKDHPQVVHFGCMKEAFLKGETEVVVLCDG